MSTAKQVAEPALSRATLDCYRFDHPPRPGRSELTAVEFVIACGDSAPVIHKGLGLTLDDVLATFLAEEGRIAREFEIEKPRVEGDFRHTVKFDHAVFRNCRLVALITLNDDAEVTATVTRFDGKFPTVPTRIFI